MGTNLINVTRTSKDYDTESYISDRGFKGVCIRDHYGKKIMINESSGETKAVWIGMAQSDIIINETGYINNNMLVDVKTAKELIKTLKAFITHDDIHADKIDKKKKSKKSDKSKSKSKKTDKNDKNKKDKKKKVDTKKKDKTKSKNDNKNKDKKKKKLF